MNTTLTSINELPTSYNKLVALYMPRPIHDATDYENASEIVALLAGHELTVDQEDYLEIISQMIEAYENETLSKPKKLSGFKALNYLLEESDMNSIDLANLLGIDKSTAAKILKGNRKLTLDHVRNLSRRFKVSSDLFIG
jgi:HTH-type transcriptional regulator / antitoxin HigA